MNTHTTSLALFAAIALPLAAPAQAATWLDIHGLSKHYHNTEQVFNEVHPGVGITVDLSEDSALSVGTYYNSLYKQSAYLTYTKTVYSYKDVVRLNLQAGLATGYLSNVIVTATPVISFGGDKRLNIGVIPPVEGLTPMVVFANISVRLN